MDRVADVIRTEGGVGYSVLIEEILLAHFPEVGDCAVVAAPVDGACRPVAVVAPCEQVADTGALLRRANQVLRSLGQPELAFIELADIGTGVPLGSTGKVLKRQLRERLSQAAGVTS